MPKIFLSKALKGAFSVSDFLRENGTLKAEIVEPVGGFLFEIIYKEEDFYFALSKQGDLIVFQRTSFVNVVSIGEFALDRFHLIVRWTPSTLNIFIRGVTGGDVLRNVTIDTTPVHPPNSLIEWAWRENLLPISEYQNVEDLRNKVTACLQSVDTKIEMSGGFEPFWNVSYEGNKVISRIPKKEVELHSIIQTYLFDQALLGNFKLIREHRTGIGSLDFLAIATIKGQGLGEVFIEFKNAHSDDLEHGLLEQLPKYMRNQNVKYGLYCVLDFYGEWLDELTGYRKQVSDVELTALKFKSKDPLMENIRILRFKLAKPASASK